MLTQNFAILAATFETMKSNTVLIGTCGSLSRHPTWPVLDVTSLWPYSFLPISGRHGLSGLFNDRAFLLRITRIAGPISITPSQSCESQVGTPNTGHHNNVPSGSVLAYFKFDHASAHHTRYLLPHMLGTTCLRSVAWPLVRLLSITLIGLLVPTSPLHWPS